MDKQLHVTGMHCEGCENKINKMIAKIDGVARVKADREKEEVELEYDGSPDTIKAVEDKIDDLGYSVE